MPPLRSRPSPSPTLLLAVVGSAVALAGAPTPARAALAGAEPLTSTDRPDLRSVSLDGRTARWCFDKSLGRLPLSPRDFSLGGYRSSAVSSRPTLVRYADAGAGRLGQSCVLGDFAGSSDDLPAFTIGSVAAGAVAAIGGGAGNRGDAASLTGSDSRSGTRGHTAGPDLVGVAADPAAHRIDFSFDQGLGAIRVPTDFHFYAADGTRQDSVTASISGRVVRAQFAMTADVASAGRAFVGPAAVIGGSGSGSTPNPLASAPVPGAVGTTGRPDLQAVDVLPDGRSVDFAVGPGAPFTDGGGLDPRNFIVYRADGTALTGLSAELREDSRVRVEYAGVALTGEYLVRAAVREGAVHSSPTGEDSSAGGVAIGDNAGALAGGYTTGPDAVAVVFHPRAGTADVTFDQRVFFADRSGFRLLDAAGTDLGTAAGAVATFAPFGATHVTLRYTPGQVARARALEIRGSGPGGASSPAVFTAADGADAGNVQQVLAPAP